MGETIKRTIDFRVVGAAQPELLGKEEAGLFRRDLFHRLDGFRVAIPPLRERPEDLLPLAAHFAQRHGRTLGLGTERVLQRHAWPGNVRELRTVVERAVILTDDAVVDAAVIRDLLSGQAARLFDDLPTPSDAEPLPPSQRELLDVCAACCWDRKRIADRLGVSVATLYRRLKQAGILLQRSSGAYRLMDSHHSHDSQHSHEARENHESFSPSTTPDLPLSC